MPGSRSVRTVPRPWVMSTHPVVGPREARRPQRCPACRARVLAEQRWCSLCHHDLRAVPEASRAPGRPEPDDTGPVGAAVAQQGVPGIEATPGPAGSGTAQEPPEALDARVDRLMAGLLQEERAARVRVPGLSGILSDALVSLTRTRLRRTVLALGGSAVFGLLMTLGSLVLGWLM